jgi:hypothetical protein
MPNKTIHDYARIGAKSRLIEIQFEIDSIRAAFPGIDGAAPARRKPRRPVVTPAKIQAAPAEHAKPKRRRMSAAARKAISQAQKKRWAALKAKTS